MPKFYSMHDGVSEDFIRLEREAEARERERSEHLADIRVALGLSQYADAGKRVADARARGRERWLMNYCFEVIAKACRRTKGAVSARCTSTRVWLFVEDEDPGVVGRIFDEATAALEIPLAVEQVLPGGQIIYSGEMASEERPR